MLYAKGDEKLMSTQNNVKFGELHKNLAKLNLTTEELDLPVRVYNRLKRSGIDNLQQLLAVSKDELKAPNKFPQMRCDDYIEWMLGELSEKVQRGEL